MASSLGLEICRSDDPSSWVKVHLGDLVFCAKRQAKLPTWDTNQGVRVSHNSPFLLVLTIFLFFRFFSFFQVTTIKRGLQNTYCSYKLQI